MLYCLNYCFLKLFYENLDETWQTLNFVRSPSKMNLDYNVNVEALNAHFRMKAAIFGWFNEGKSQLLLKNNNNMHEI